MNKTTIDLDIVLPEVPDERDECVNRIIPNMSSKRGIEKVHIIPETETSKAQLCFHYNPYEVSLEKVQRLAEDAGIHWYRYTHGRCEKRCKRNIGTTY